METDGRENRPNWLRRIGGAIAIIGFIGWLSMFPIAFGAGQRAFRCREIPLGDVSGVAADSHGRVYVGSQGYARVQVYDPDGRLLDGWHVASSGGAFRIFVDKDDNLHLATARNDNECIYTPGGLLLKCVGDPNAYGNLPKESDYTARGMDGHTYRILRWSVIWPRVARIEADGKPNVIIATPICLWLFMAPFPAWLFAAAGIVILNATNPRKGDKDADSESPEGA